MHVNTSMAASIGFIEVGEPSYPPDPLPQAPDVVTPDATTSPLGHPLLGYLLTCLRTGAWRGSVWVPRFVALISAARAGRVALIWPARTGCRGERGEAQEGFAQLEVAVPSWLGKNSVIG